jgi:hypothetical protein
MVFFGSLSVLWATLAAHVFSASKEKKIASHGFAHHMKQMDALFLGWQEPFQLGAYSVTQGLNEQPSLFHIQQPWVRSLLKEKTLNIRANQGRFILHKQKMRLFDKIVLSWDQGHYVVKTESAWIHGQSKIIHGSMPVQGHCANGLFQAQGFNLNEERLHLRGPVSVQSRTFSGPSARQKKT